MARYYEENALIEFIKQHTPTINGETTMECVERAIRNAPTADVVEQVYITEDILKKGHNDPVGEKGEDALLHIKQEVARKIFDDIERLMFATKIGTLHGFYYSTALKTCVAELKKKYTESEGKG